MGHQRNDGSFDVHYRESADPDILHYDDCRLCGRFSHADMAQRIISQKTAEGTWSAFGGLERKCDGRIL